MIHLSHPEPSIALVELDVAPANVLAMAERARLLEAFAAIEADRTVRVAILTGRNGAFCTGDDLAESLTRDVAARVRPMFGTSVYMHSATVRSWLLHLEKLGLVRRLDDEKPVCWVRVAQPTAKE